MKGKKILIADDTALFLKIEESFLNRENVHVYTASSGLQALKRAVEYEPDLILLDLNMPDLKGSEVCAKIKTKEKFKKVPVLIVTAEGGEDVFKTCIEAGCDGFIIKPFEKVKFLSKIREHLAIAERRYPRIPTKISCTLTVRNENQAGIIRNISEGGAFILVPSPPSAGTMIDLKFTLPGSDGAVLCSSIARWDMPSGDSRGFGVEFLDLSEEQRQTIADLVDVYLGIG